MFTHEQLDKMSYVDLMAMVKETNRPPGGKETIRDLINLCFITPEKKVLDIGCNTGYCSFEISRLVNCRVTGIDINRNMIREARKVHRTDKHRNMICFKVADATMLPFSDNFFDVIISGGSTAFIRNRKLALMEYKRVLKFWGLVGDVNFYYTRKPPQHVIQKLEEILNFPIMLWDKKYWINLYREAGFEIHHILDKSLRTVNKESIHNYMIDLSKNIEATDDIRRAVVKKLTPMFEVFNENQRFMSYSVFCLRKRGIAETPYLFEA